MAEPNFEIQQLPLERKPFQTSTPDFGDTLQHYAANANGLKAADGLLVKGILPDVNLALNETNHKPNDHVHLKEIGVGDLDLTYDANGRLASMHLDKGHGDIEDATVVDGHITENKVRGLFNTDYTFFQDGSVSSETFHPHPGENDFYRFDQSGNLVQAAVPQVDHSSLLLTNEPGHHSIQESGPQGDRSLLNYDDQGRFQNGEVSIDGKLWSLKPGPHNEAIAEPSDRT